MLSPLLQAQIVLDLREGLGCDLVLGTLLGSSTFRGGCDWAALMRDTDIHFLPRICKEGMSVCLKYKPEQTKVRETCSLLLASIFPPGWPGL